MKWGVRRYQNPDGTLTPAGRKRLNRQEIKYDHWNTSYGPTYLHETKTKDGKKCVVKVNPSKKGDGYKQVSDKIVRNIDKVISNCTKAASDKFYELNEEWNSGTTYSNKTKKQFEKDLNSKLDMIDISQVNNEKWVATAVYNNKSESDWFGGHTMIVEFDPVSGKIKHVSLEG